MLPNAHSKYQSKQIGSVRFVWSVWMHRMHTEPVLGHFDSERAIAYSLRALFIHIVVKTETKRNYLSFEKYIPFKKKGGFWHFMVWGDSADKRCAVERVCMWTSAVNEHLKSFNPSYLDIFAGHSNRTRFDGLVSTRTTKDLPRAAQANTRNRNGVTSTIAASNTIHHTT